MSKANELEDRLLIFAKNSLKTADKLQTSYSAQHLSKQLIRSATAPALLYAEARFAESSKDFVHKMKIALKELSETRCNLKIIHQMEYISHDITKPLIKESSELIAIFVSSINTVKSKNNLR